MLESQSWAIVEHLKKAGTTARERLNVVVNTRASWLAQVFSTHPDMPDISVPASFLVFTLIRALLMLCSVTERVSSNGTHFSYSPASGIVTGLA